MKFLSLPFYYKNAMSFWSPMDVVPPKDNPKDEEMEKMSTQINKWNTQRNFITNFHQRPYGSNH